MPLNSLPQSKPTRTNLGFSDCRIVPVGDAPHAAFFESWLAAGRAGEMQYLARNVAKRRSPALLAEAGQAPFASMIVLGVDYHQYDLPPEVRDDPSRGIIASYAWGDDYHELIRPLLYELDAFVRSVSGRSTPGQVPGGHRSRARARLGAGSRIGFHRQELLHDRAGSRLLAAAGRRARARSAGAGPTLGCSRTAGSSGASACRPAASARAACRPARRCFVAAYDLDPQRCISYWTIEAAGDIPLPLRPLFGNRIFGCDICQEVCPYNRRLGERTPLLAGLHAQAHRVAPPLLEGFAPATPYWLDDRAFSDHFVRSPIKRAKRRGMLRNVCVALGNWGASETVPALRAGAARPHIGRRGATPPGRWARSSPGIRTAPSPNGPPGCWRPGWRTRWTKACAPRLPPRWRKTAITGETSRGSLRIS